MMHQLLIVDDEAPARSRLRKVVKDIESIQVVGEAATGREAVEAFGRHQPDIVLLDVEMPHGDGFFVVEEGIKTGVVPEIIFVTAYDQFAISAFEYGAVDYLLKPVETSRIETAVSRAIERLRQRSAEERVTRLQALLDARSNQPTQQADDNQLWLKENGQSTRVTLDSILFLEADRDYVRITTANTSFHIRGTIADFERRLQSKGFIRTHRSVIVRTDAVAQLLSKGPNSFELALSDGHRQPVGRSYNAKVKRLFGR